MKSIELKPLEKFALRFIRDAGIAGWYRLEHVLPAEDYPNEDRNTVRILKYLEQHGLIISVEHQDKKDRYAITEAGCKVLTELGL